MYDVSAWKHFDLVMSALKELVILSETEEGIIAFERPALRLGHSLVKNGNLLSSNECCDQIYSVGNFIGKQVKPRNFAVTSNLLKLRKYLSVQMLDLGAKLETIQCYQILDKFGRNPLTKIVLTSH